MNLVDKLMAIDKGKFADEKTEQMKAVHMSKILGEDVMIKIKALSGDQYADITSRMIDRNGETNYSKSYDINAMIVVDGLVEPNVRDNELQKHFGAATPKDLVKILFRGAELTSLADKITELSGFSKSDTEVEEEIKN